MLLLLGEGIDKNLDESVAGRLDRSLAFEEAVILRYDGWRFDLVFGIGLAFFLLDDEAKDVVSRESLLR